MYLCNKRSDNSPHLTHTLHLRVMCLLRFHQRFVHLLDVRRLGEADWRLGGVFETADVRGLVVGFHETTVCEKHANVCYVLKYNYIEV